MDETTTPKTNPFTKAAGFVKKHDRKILAVTTVTSVGAAIIMRTGLAQHNAFLKEHGLYETFYAIENTPEA